MTLRRPHEKGFALNSLRDRLSCRPRIFNALHCLHLVSPVTQTRPEELDCLARHARGRREALEIGTFMGVSAAVIAAALSPAGRLHCVDPYPGSDAVLRIARRHLARAGVAGRVEFHRGTAASSADRLPQAIDFAFIDGDHSREGLAADWRLVAPRLQPGGVVCLHDTISPPGPPCGAVDYFREHIRVAPGFSAVESCASLSVVRRDG